MNYKVTVTFQGMASLEIDAASPEEARRLASELTVADLARTGHADILQFKIAAREITPISALGGSSDGTTDEAAADRPRPSGWYRPA